MEKTNWELAEEQRQQEFLGLFRKNAEAQKLLAETDPRLLRAVRQATEKEDHTILERTVAMLSVEEQLPVRVALHNLLDQLDRSRRKVRILLTKMGIYMSPEEAALRQLKRERARQRRIRNLSDLD